MTNKRLVRRLKCPGEEWKSRGKETLLSVIRADGSGRKLLEGKVEGIEDAVDR